jgi:peptidylprolyl isomerase
MRNIINFVLGFVVAVGLSSGAFAAELENILYLELKTGRVTIELRPDLAPNHVARVKELAREGFYDGLLFHRVIAGFMAQTGDPLGNGTGGSGQNLDAEFSDERHVRGTLSMARSQNPNSADSQFFRTWIASTRCGARLPTAWSMSIRSSSARRPTTARSATRTALSA